MSESVRQTATSWQSDRLAWICALPVLIVHLALAGRYDLFRDELYFIVCGQHPAFGYADQPPLVPLAAAALYGLGGTAFWVRLPVVLAAAALVFVAVRFVRLLKGGRIAALVAALACAIAPILMGLAAILSTSSFDPMAFTVIALLLVKAQRDGDDRALLLAGLAAGLILQVKYSLVLWAAGLAVGIVATPSRALLARPALWKGLAVAVVIAAPSLAWQAVNGWPFLALSAAAEGKNADVALLPFIGNQAFILNPLLAPLWIAGLVAPFVSRTLRDLRFLSIAYLVTFTIVRIGHGKDYYLAALYPALFAIGAVWLAGLAQQAWHRRVMAGWMAAASAFSAIAAPIALPILPPEQLQRYMVATGIAPQPQERSFARTDLPQQFADQLGWRDFAAQVGAAWAQIPAQQRSGSAILVDNYGEAAALDLYGQGLPPALSGHNQYGLWGLRGQSPTSLLVVTREPERLATRCRSVVVLKLTASPFAMGYENGKAIALCTGPIRSLREVWPDIVHFG